MRQWLIQRIPQLTPPVPDLGQASLLHRLLLMVDLFWGQMGSPIPYITISCRTALRCRNPETAPMWALILGVFLETLNPGHLQSALGADLGRAIKTQNEINSPNS